MGRVGVVGVLVLVAVFVVGTSFTLLMYRSLFQVYREADKDRQRLLFTRALPIFVGLFAVQGGGAAAGALTGRGALVGLLVTSAALMSAGVVAIVVMLIAKGIRGPRGRP